MARDCSQNRRPEASHAGMERIFGLPPELYHELVRSARCFMQHERRDHTLSPTGLVHEAFLKLGGRLDWQFESKAHFRALYAQAFRRVLVDYARKRIRSPEGQGKRVSLHSGLLESADHRLDVLSLDEALHELAEIDPVRAEVVSLRFFGGLSEDEVAEQLQISRTSVQACWRDARAWLRSRLAPLDASESKT